MHGIYRWFFSPEEGQKQREVVGCPFVLVKEIVDEEEKKDMIIAVKRLWGGGERERERKRQAVTMETKTHRIRN